MTAKGRHRRRDQPCGGVVVPDTLPCVAALPVVPFGVVLVPTRCWSSCRSFPSGWSCSSVPIVVSVEVDGMEVDGLVVVVVPRRCRPCRCPAAACVRWHDRGCGWSTG
ncbi:hypothetical protein AB5I41_06120 [Sphingomonas sp. MMS24-JH45]